MDLRNIDTKLSLSQCPFKARRNWEELIGSLTELLWSQRLGNFRQRRVTRNFGREIQHR